MTYKGASYNIPLDIYLPPPYPVRPPVAFVRPTSTMLVKENHRHVAPDGMVYMPYLHEWRPHTHNLVEMVVMMSSLFGSSPPVFARPPGSPPSPAMRPPSYEEANRRQNSGGYASLSQSRQEEADRIEAERVARVAIQKEIDDANAAAEAARRAEEDEKRREEERRRLMEYERRTAEETRRLCTGVVRSAVEREYREARTEIAGDLRDQGRLERGREELELALTGLKDRKEELENANKKADEAIISINLFLEDLESGKAEEKEAPVDELASPLDVHSAQMLRLAAENQAISDALYFVDRGLVRGRLDLTGHMKTVRRLAKKQFMVRAHLMKVAQVRAAEHKAMC